MQCHRLSSDTENTKNKEVKLIIQTKFSEDRNGIKINHLAPAIKKKKLDPSNKR